MALAEANPFVYLSAANLRLELHNIYEGFDVEAFTTFIKVSSLRMAFQMKTDFSAFQIQKSFSDSQKKLHQKNMSQNFSNWRIHF